ncbi:glycoside hydrolase family 15 protein [Thiohalomonas denitrificans]|uniref:glycoside hydrolase family 15 protein n=1 Tax=Thiohalomonas denitrificans TaxID=415747 RepID=UPI0026EAE011|nr:glycoside hydrolase family 15 protein [Thiohalomonas denitrificans]
MDAYTNSRQARFGPLHYTSEGYLAIEEYGLIGDGAGAALVGRDGAIPWLCAPRFDSPPLFCGLLDAQRGGAFTIAPERLDESRHYYLPDTGVLATELRGPDGVVRITDALTFRTGANLNEGVRAARGELLRQVEVLEGDVPLRIDMALRGTVDAEPHGDGWRIRTRDGLELRYNATIALQGLRSIYYARAGECFHLVLRWASGSYRYDPIAHQEVLEATIASWRRWISGFEYGGPQAALVRRSAITLKLLDHFENGAIIAAPTSSLPEAVGGPRNWDYRYTWVRDAAFSVYALRGVSLTVEAQAFLAWVLDDVENPGRPRVLYDLDGGVPPQEWEDGELEGYRGSAPVRWGNAAVEQRQHDVFGEILDSAYQWANRGGRVTPHLWSCLHTFVEQARVEWRKPDHGIWEVRTSGHPFTYSAALCQVALDRGARIAERLGLPGDIRGWRADAAVIRETILNEAWNSKRNTLTEHLGGGWLDASLLTLPLRRVVPFDHPRMIATVEAVRQRLGAGDGLLYRYIPEESPDGLPGHEGAFLLCSFWLLNNLTGQGRLDEATALYDALCNRTNDLGLLPEQIDPATGAFLGNFPQAFSHVGLIASGRNLARALQGNRDD